MGRSDKEYDEYTDGSEAEAMTVTLNLDEGDVECAVVDIFEHKGRDYIILQPLDENGENHDGSYWIYRYSENPDDPNEEPVIDYIEDDAEYEEVDEAYDEYLDSQEFDEMI